MKMVVKQAIARLGLSVTLGIAALGVSGSAAALDLAGAHFDEQIVVAGQPLRLNGAGVGYRFLFKVYAVGLYLPERRFSAQEVMNADEPRRMVITALRELSSNDFNDAVMNHFGPHGEDPDAHAAQKVLHLGRIIASQAPVLKRGDSLTLDWVPNAGMSLRYNQSVTPLPGHDVGFYNTLLTVWLGDKASDPALRSQLLGRPSASRASAD